MHKSISGEFDMTFEKLKTTFSQLKSLLKKFQSVIMFGHVFKRDSKDTKYSPPKVHLKGST